MANLTEIVRGTKEQYLAQAYINPTAFYVITNMPQFAISNADMALAIDTQSSLYEVGAIYVCKDIGTYTFGSLYRFTLTGTTYSWVKVVTTPATTYSISLPTSSSAYTETSGVYSYTKALPGLHTYDAVLLETNDTFTNTYSGLISSQTDQITFALNSIPTTSMTLTFTIVVANDGGDLTERFVNRTFGENSWETISSVSQTIASENMSDADILSTYGWALGDTKTETLSTGEVISVQIIGFNHDTLSSDHTSKAGITMQMVDCLATTYPMNTTNTNAGGWGASVMRTTTLPTIKATLSNALQNAIKLVDKKAANGGSSNYSATETLSDDLFLLSGVEIFGSDTSYAQDGANEGTQYAYWAEHNTNTDRIKNYDTDANGEPETATFWWERSSYSSYTFNFCSVYSSGIASSSSANVSRGVAFAFCV